MKTFRLFSVVEGKRHALVETEASDNAAAVAAGKAKWPDQRIEAEEVTGAASQPAGVGTPPGGTRPLSIHPLRERQPNTSEPATPLPARLLEPTPDESGLYVLLTQTGMAPDCAVVVARTITELQRRLAAVETLTLPR